MRLLPSDPDIQTIVARIQNGDIDLQPDFQRGEVWSNSKQAKLIDSVLRQWHVPPIHVIENSDSATQDVLDGQQRLVAIRDFVDGIFPIDGKTQPLDPEIMALSGLRYSQLPPAWKRRFDQFTIRVFRIVDFKAEEPAELFFRLNQPVMLTNAEQRNAFFGPVRSQIKDLANSLNQVTLGFSNSRMGLDDVVARVCVSVENRTIATKITAAKLTERYRQREPLSEDTYSICHRAIDHVIASEVDWKVSVRLNKATLFSWLWVAGCASDWFGLSTAKLLAHAMSDLEFMRAEKGRDAPVLIRSRADQAGLPIEHFVSLVRLYLDRSTSRVADVSSVIARDFVSWLFMKIAVSEYGVSLHPEVPYIHLLEEVLATYADAEPDPTKQLLEPLIDFGQWGGMA